MPINTAGFIKNGDKIEIPAVFVPEPHTTVNELNGVYREYAYPTTIDTLAKFEQWRVDTGIADGTFSNIRVGDSVTINDGTVTCEWLVAGFNTETNKGDQNVLTGNHVALIPKTKYGSDGQMNTSNTTSGGFFGCAMWSTLQTIASRLSNVLGNYLLTRDVLVTTSVASTTSAAGGGRNGSSNNWAWKASKITLLTDVQVSGGTICSSGFFDVGEGCEKLPIFNFISPVEYLRASWWLRGVSSTTEFCRVHAYGYVVVGDASYSQGIRPLIIIG